MIEKKSSESLDKKKPGDFMTMKERKIYNKWRLKILFSIIIGYGTYYICRQNFSMVMPSYMQEFNYTKTQIGWVLTFASVIYGVGKFVNGYISDKSNARYFFSIGLFFSAIMTFCMGLTNSLFALGVFWVLNNWFQSMGWPPVARMLTHWFAPKELGTKWALGAASHMIGGAVISVLSGYIITYLGWRYAFFVPSLIALLVVFVIFNQMQESPKKLGMPPVEAYKGDESFIEKVDQDHFTTAQIYKSVFLNKNIWCISVVNMCIHVVKVGLMFWMPVFLISFKGYSFTNTGWQIAAFDISGLFGGVIAGWISDKLFKGQRASAGSIFLVFLAITLFIVWKMPDEYSYLMSIPLIISGFFIYGPQILVGVASADFSSKKAVGTASGFVGSTGYLGSSISGVAVGWLIDNYGWGSVFCFFIANALIGAMFFMLTHNSNSKQKTK